MNATIYNKRIKENSSLSNENLVTVKIEIINNLHRHGEFLVSDFSAFPRVIDPGGFWDLF